MNFVGKFDAKLHVDGSGAHPDGRFHVDSISAHAPLDAIIVPDADLLFNGDFKRSGVDLILSRDDHELVVQDYFKGEKRAALASPDGARLTGDIINALAGHVEVAQADGSASAGKVIGHVTKLVGTATAIRNGVSIILNQGDNVEKGDVVQSGSGSTLGVTFIDGTVFGLSSNARMVLNEMVYDPNGSNNSSLISLVAGTISFVAGETAKHGDMKIDTPVATMGIRGTAVVVEIDFDVPGQNGVPEAKFQVLVEPDGSTGSYILFDKNTLAPIAVVNQAGQQVEISNGNVSFTNSPLSPELQKLITDVFALKFTDNTNPQTFTHFTDTLIPQQAWLPVQLANSGPPVVVHVTITPLISASATSSAAPAPTPHLNVPPVVTTVDSALTERAGVTGSSAIDTTSGTISFADINLGDRPTAQTTISSFTYQNAQHQDITASAQELKDIQALENIPLLVVQAPGNTYFGTANWTFNVPDKDFDFLGAGDTLTLTYTAKVDSNYTGGNIAGAANFTITITGTNDAPVITTGPETVAFINVGTTTTGPNLPPPTGPTTNTLKFKDPDLTDTHTVSTDLTAATLSGNGVPTLDMQALETKFPRPMGVFESALSAAVTTDSSGTGHGTITWTLADISSYYADIVPAGETLTLTYTVTVKDSQGATSHQNVIVTILGSEPPAVVWVETTTSGSTGPGDWNGANNWETGTVPLASDDVDIITDQLQQQTPFYPVTVNVGETASANSVTMDDFSDLANTLGPPELDVGTASGANDNGTLTISTDISLNADAILKVFGTLSVGTIATILGNSVLDNFGSITLGQGGQFGGSSTITNSGKIEVVSETLDVQVNIANSGGTLQIDKGATLQLNGATINGGTINDFSSAGGGNIDVTAASTIAGTSTTDANLNGNGTGTVTLDAALTLDYVKLNGITIENGATPRGLLTIKDTVEVAGAVTLLNDTVTNTGATLQVDDNQILTLSGTEIIGGIINDFSGPIGGKIDVTGDSKIDSGATLNDGAVTVENDVTLTLDDMTVNGTTITDKGTIVLDDTVQLSGGATIEGVSGSALGTITNNGTLEVAGAAELLNDTLTNTSGIIQVDDNQILTLSGTEIIGGTINDFSGSVGGNIDVTGNSKIDGGATLNNGFVTVESGVTLTLDNDTVTGTTFTDTASGATFSVDSGADLNFVGATVYGGLVNIGGTFNSTGTSAITDAAVTIAASGTVEATTGKLTISSLSISNAGLLEANGGTLEIDGSSTPVPSLVDNFTADTGLNSGWTVISPNPASSVQIVPGTGLEVTASYLNGGSDLFSGSNLNAPVVLHSIDPTSNWTIETKLDFSPTDNYQGAGILLATTTSPFTSVDQFNRIAERAFYPDGGGNIVEGAGGSDSYSSGSIYLEVTKAGDLYTTSFSSDGINWTVLGTETNATAYDEIGVFTLRQPWDGAPVSSQADFEFFDVTPTVTLTNTGTLKATNDGKLVLNNEIVSNGTGTIQVDGGSTLDMGSTTVSGGTLANGGTLDSTGISAITGVSITNTGLIEATSGVLTIDPATLLTLTNSSTLEANGGEFDITGEQVNNTGALQAINAGTLKLTSTTVTNTGAGTVTVANGSTLDLASANIDGGTVGNSGTIDNVSGSNTISAAVTNTGTIEVKAGTLDLSGGLSGVGSLIIDAGATLELAGANAQTITFAGGTGSETLQLDNVLGLSFTGTIAGTSSTGGTFTITGAGNITSTSGDGIDFTASGGVTGNEADVTLTPSGAITGAANGINVIQNGAGDITVDPSGNVIGNAGDGVIAEDSAAGTGNIVVDSTTGSATGTGTGSVGLLAENLNAANAGNITVTQLGGAGGDLYGIEASTLGNGNISVEVAGIVAATVQYGIRAVSTGTGDITVTTDAGTVINSGGAGIEAINKDTSIAASADSTITVTAHGTIDSGTDSDLDGSAPQGISAGYYGADAANTNINGTVVINNFANITAAAGYGIEGYNFGNGDVTVNDKAGTTVSGAAYGVAAYALSGGTGNVTVKVAANATITGTSSFGIDALNLDAGNVRVSTSAGDVINSGSIGIDAQDEATSILASANSTVHVIANGTINSGADLTPIGTDPAGISAGYFPGEVDSPDNNVAGNVIVQSNATIIAAGGAGINAYNWGTGNVTVSTGMASSITAPGDGIQAYALDGGDVSVTNHGSVSGAHGIYATASLAGTVSVTNSGHVTGTSYAGIYVAQNGTGSTGSTTITNTGTVLGSTADAAIAVYDNATGTVTIDNTGGTIGPAVVSAPTEGIFESGGDITINNTGEINGTLYLANGTFNNEIGGTWQVAGVSEFGQQASTGVKAFTIDNAGTIDLIGGASLSDASGLNISNTGTIDNVSGSNTVSAAITNTGAGTVTVASGSTLTLASASITGGTVTDNGTIGVTGASMLAGVTFESAAGGTDTIDNTGTSLTLGTGGLTLGGSTAFTLALDGTGTLALNGQTIKATTAGMTLENDGNTISGFGQIGDGTTANLTLHNASGMIEALGGTLKIATGNAVTNAGTLEANGETLLVTTKILNSGLIEATGGGTLDLKGGGAGQIDWTGGTPVAGSNGIALASSADTLLVDSSTGQLQLAGTTANGAVSLGGGTIEGNGTTAEILDNFNNVISGDGHIGLGTDLLTLHNDAAGTIDANVSGQMISIDTVATSNAGTIEATLGGEVNFAGGDITNSNALTASDGSKLAFSNETVVNTGTINLDGHVAATQLIIHGTLTLESTTGPSTATGSGELILTGGSQNAILSDLHAATLVNVDNTISGSGAIGDTDLTVQNDQFGVIDATGVLALNAVTTTNAGLLEATGSGTLQIEGSVNNSNLIEADGGTVFVASTATITGTPSVTITAGGVAEFAGGSVIQTLDLNATFSGTGTLVLDHSQHYGGMITGFGTGDTIDLTDLTYSPTETDVWNSTTDTLTIYNGTHTSTLNFGSGYSQNSFALTSDASGDTEVVLSPAQASLSGLDTVDNAVNGYAVTAGLTDSHASGLTYQWLDDGVAIANATGASYTPTANDLGQVLDVVVGFTDGGVAEQVTALAGTVAVPPAVSSSDSAASTNENTPLTINSLSVSFADAGSDTIDVTLDASHGTLSFGGATGVTESGGGNTGLPLILSGTLGAINAALGSGVVYTPTTGYVGIDNLTVEVNDGIFNSNTATVNLNVLGPVANNVAITNAAAPTSGNWSYDPENGHYYQYVATSTDWNTAMSAAAADNGAYLANITSGAENVFVSGLLPNGATAWTGGESTQDTGTPTANAATFHWLSGPEAGMPFTYASWNNDSLPPGGGEPSGFPVPDGNIEALQVGSNGEWNDVPASWSDAGYVEEYGGLTGQVAFTENTSTDIATGVLLAHDTDTDGGTPTVTAVGTAAHGTVTLSDGLISYDPDLDYSGADSFTYTISDGTFTSTGTVSFNVAAVPTLVWNTSSGDWTTSAADWSTGAVPVSADDVTINAASGTAYTVTIAGAETASAQTLTLDSAAATLVDAGSLTLTGGLAVETGTFEMQGGSLHAQSITVAAGGIFEGYGTVGSPVAVTGTVEASGGTLDFTNYVTGTGTFEIGAGATLEFDGIVSTGTTVSFAAGTTGTLIVEQSTSFQGEVSGLASGDQLDLGQLLSNGSVAATQATDIFGTSVSYDSVHGTTLLTVTDEANGASTFINLVGDYSTTSWSVSSDGHGGVDVAETPAPPVITAPESGTTASNFVTMDYPGADQASGTGTFAYGINNSGAIVGGYTIDSQHTSGFEYNGGYSAVGVSGSQDNNADGINNFGEIAGFNSPVRSTPRYGFTDDGGSYTEINLPGAGSTTANGINDSGVVVGAVYLHGTPIYSGYIDNGGSITYLDASGTASLSDYTAAEAINNAGQVVGVYTSTYGSNDQGFLYQNGSYTTISDPNGAEGTQAYGINNSGEIVGQYTDSSGTSHGFIDINGVFTTIDDPLGINTVLTGINDAGQVVGYYEDAGGAYHGFAASLNGVSTQEDRALLLTTLRVSDAAAGLNPIEVTLDAAHGALTLGDTTNLTVNGQGSDALTLTGTQAAIDAALAAGLTYTPTLNSGFADVLTITADDLGHNGTGAALSTTQDVGIVVTPADSIAAGATYTVSAPSADTIAFTGSTGTLDLTQPSTFTGEIAGISGSGDVLDLHGFTAGTTTAVSSSFNSTLDTTTLTVTDSSDHLTETFTLAGDYSTSTWNVSTDGSSGGVDIVDPPGAPVAAATNPAPAATSTIVASGPNQILTGHAASDTFAFNFTGVGQTTVTDFHPTTDTLQFSSQLFANLQAALNAMHDDGHGDTVIALDAHDTITLTGILKAQLNASDFHFV